MNRTEAQLVKSLELIAENLESVTLPFLKELEGSTKQRIHNFGKDSAGDQIGINASRKGKYSPGYEKKKGKIVGEGNIYPINLQLRGDLLRSFTVGTSGGKYVLKFQNEENSNKAAWAEKNFKTEIYRPSDDQLDDAKDVLQEGIKEFLKDLF